MAPSFLLPLHLPKQAPKFSKFYRLKHWPKACCQWTMLHLICPEMIKLTQMCSAVSHKTDGFFAFAARELSKNWGHKHDSKISYQLVPTDGFLKLPIVGTPYFYEFVCSCEEIRRKQDMNLCSTFFSGKACHLPLVYLREPPTTQNFMDDGKSTYMNLPAILH